MSVRLDDAVVRRGEFALHVDTVFDDGVITAILGPNGSGKSTLLRAVAGLEPVDEGSIAIAGQIVDAADGAFVRPRERKVGVVFQDYALFPHLSVLENVAFGPRSRGVGRQAARTQAREQLARLGIDEFADRRPGQVSGGQAQRVALARALATTPDVLLLDEPLSALDVETRDTVRSELLAQLRAFDGAILLVTHEPLDAMMLADRVLVLEGGVVVQDAAPADLALRPATSYVAALLGLTLLRGETHDGELQVDGGGVVHLADRTLHGRTLAAIRPESVSLYRSQPDGSPRNVWPGTVAAVQPAGDRVRVLVDGQPSVVAVVTPDAVTDLQLDRGTPVWVSVKATEIAAYRAP